MPILPREEYLSPPNLFEVENTPADGLRWQVAHTKGRQEKAITRELLATGLSFFLPCAKQPSENPRVPASFLPVFPSYLFVRVPDEKAIPYQTRDRIVRIMDVADQAKIADELRRVWWLLGAREDARREPGLEPGTAVEIRMGPMAGLRGILLEKKGETRFVVRVDFIQQGISITVDREFLKVL